MSNNEPASQEDYTFSTIFTTYYATLCYVAQRILSDTMLAEEVVADTFEHIWKKDKWRHIDNIGAFLYTAVKNRSLNILERRSTRRRHYSKYQAGVEISEDKIFEAICYAEVLRSLTEAIKRLPSQCRKVIELSYIDGLTIREISEIMGISESTVKTQRFRGIKILKNILSSRVLQMAVRIIWMTPA